MCGDALVDLDLTEAVKNHKKKGAIASLITKKVTREQVSSYGVVVSDENGRIKAFQEKPDVEDALSDSINTGIYLFEPEIFNYIPSGDKFDIGACLLYTSDAADEEDSVDLGGRRIIKKNSRFSKLF